MTTSTEKTALKYLEKGAAGINIELADGRIEVRHSEDNTILAYLDHAPAGTWDKLWNCLHELGLERLYS